MATELCQYRAEKDKNFAADTQPRKSLDLADYVENGLEAGFKNRLLPDKGIREVVR